MDNLKFEGRSREMVQAIADSVPKIMRGRAEKAAKKYIAEHNVQVVTEELVIQMVNEKAPANMKDKILAKLNAL